MEQERTALVFGTAAERERDARAVARIAYLRARQDYYRAGEALNRLRECLESLGGVQETPGLSGENHSDSAKAAHMATVDARRAECLATAVRCLSRALDLVDMLEHRPGVRCALACRSLLDLLVAVGAGQDDTAERAVVAALVAQTYPSAAPKTLGDLLELGALACVESMLTADAGRWLRETWKGEAR